METAPPPCSKEFAENGIDTYSAMSKLLKGVIRRGEIGCQSQLFSILLSLLTCAAHHLGFCIGLHFLHLTGLALVMELLALAYRDFYLDSAAFQIQPGRHKREPFFPRFHLQTLNLGAMQQQFAFPHRRVIHNIAVRVLADVRVHQPRLVIGDLRVALLKLHFPGLRRLHFGPCQHQPSLIAVLKIEIVASRTVVA
jgi:hypothetical protein